MAAPDKEKGKNAGALFPFTLSQNPFPFRARPGNANLRLAFPGQALNEYNT
jgi:hypothetical protein